jgi:hypothetical protein
MSLVNATPSFLASQHSVWVAGKSIMVDESGNPEDARWTISLGAQVT